MQIIWYKTKQLFSKVLLVITLVILLFCGLGKLPAAPAFAVVASHQEAPGQILYKSRHTIRDNNSNSWQLIVFKQIQPGQVSSTYLRLVGFPGTVEFKHPHPLKITVQTREFLAEDVFAQQAPGANIGQYDIASVLPHLQLGQRVKLEIPVNNAFPLSLAVPAEIVWEWQDIAAKGTENS